MALGFLAHGYATHEFEVTEERLGVYLPVSFFSLLHLSFSLILTCIHSQTNTKTKTEHIDNPKGYGEGEDARKYHPKLRPPVDPRELEIDPQTGMKNYIANGACTSFPLFPACEKMLHAHSDIYAEHGTWDTSKALVRRTLERCIHLGRQHRSQGNKHDEYEAYRLLGQAVSSLSSLYSLLSLTKYSLHSTSYANHNNRPCNLYSCTPSRTSLRIPTSANLHSCRWVIVTCLCISGIMYASMRPTARWLHRL